MITKLLAIATLLFALIAPTMAAEEDAAVNQVIVFTLCGHPVAITAADFGTQSLYLIPRNAQADYEAEDSALLDILAQVAYDLRAGVTLLRIEDHLGGGYSCV
jgi:hypothetical protein